LVVLDIENSPYKECATEGGNYLQKPPALHPTDQDPSVGTPACGGADALRAWGSWYLTHFTMEL